MRYNPRMTDEEITELCNAAWGALSHESRLAFDPIDWMDGWKNGFRAGCVLRDSNPGPAD